MPSANCKNPDGNLFDRFIIPPMDVIDFRSPVMTNLKRQWEKWGVRGEVGRDACPFNTDYSYFGDFKHRDDPSVFHPGLCRVAYTWYCPPSGVVLDPFAGGSVRGIVAGVGDLHYHGIELRQEQVAANETNWADLSPEGVKPVWVCGDSLTELDGAPVADFVFSCPPYGDLERYSDNPADLSTMTTSDFRVAYKTIINKSVAKLKQDSFAVFVVGDYRDGKGYQTRLPEYTTQCFIEAGCQKYNEVILLVPWGTASMRTSGQFDVSRKLPPVHQQMLVFVKGDARKATQKVLTGTHPYEDRAPTNGRHLWDGDIFDLFGGE